MPNNAIPLGCPVCRHMPVQVTAAPEPRTTAIDCENCGQHQITNGAWLALQAENMSDEDHARLAYAVRKRPDGDVIDHGLAAQLLKSAQLPDALECVGNLVLYLAAQSTPGGFVFVSMQAMPATIGVPDKHAVQWVTEQARGMGLLERDVIDGDMGANNVAYRLTVAGWQHRDKLLREGAGSRHAFMAMDFNYPDLWALFNNHLRPAVAETDFDLRTTDHPGKTAGLIDNRLRVEIRTARFLVCDLTHGNRGAYWEAGFAEGIGRPVFYICRKAERKSRSKATRPHFDAAHQSIVAWDPADPAPAMTELKAMIRATLPDLARMEDA
jgi:hypothetical protein